MDKSMKIAIILSAVDKASRVINSTVGKVQRGLNKFGNVASVGGAAATLFFANAVKAAEDSGVATNRLSQVFKSMGQDYETATKQSAAYASSLQMQIGFEDEAIMAVQAKIATFEKASNEVARSNNIFNRATVAAFNLQAAGFGEADKNAIQLGKALQDPIKGINALSKSGVSFTEAERAKIKMLVRANKIFEAQSIVMDAVEGQVGNVAKATVTNSTRMRLAWGEVQEKIGSALLPVFTEFATYLLDKVIPAVSAFVEKHPELVKWIGFASVGLLALGAAAKVVAFITPVLSTAMTALKFVLIGVKGALLLVGKTVAFVGRMMLRNPMILAIAAIAAGVYIVIRHWSKIKAFFARILKAVGEAFERAWEFIKSIPERVWNGMVSLWNGITGFFSDVWSGVRDVTAQLWNAIGDAIMAPIIWIKKAWQDFKDWFTNLFKGPGKIMDEMVEKAAAAQKYANDAAKPIARMNLATANSPGYTAILQRASGRPAGVNTPTPAPVPQPVAMAGKSTVNFSPVYNINGGDPSSVQSMIASRDKDLLKTIEEAKRKKDRTKF